MTTQPTRNKDNGFVDVSLACVVTIGTLMEREKPQRRKGTAQRFQFIVVSHIQSVYKIYIYRLC